MSPEQVPVDDPEVLHRLLANTEALLLDFDGPVCSVFAGFPAHLVAHQLRGVLADGGHNELPAEIEKAEDPFDVLSYAATLGPDEARYVEAAMRAHEIEAVASARPAAGAHDLVRAWHAAGRKLAIVSNNSVAAIKVYLRLHDLSAYVDALSARAASTSLLKPNPYLVNRVMDMINIPSVKCALVGDSITDIQAAKSSGVMAIGYANKLGKFEILKSASPDLVVTSVEALVQVVKGWHTP